MNKKILIIIVALISVVFGIYHIDFSTQAEPPDKVTTVAIEGAETATFAGGCFWCSESDFEKVYGVIEAVSGYTGGKEKNPTYKDVSYGRTSHMEGVQVYYDPDRVTYDTLLKVFWRHINPTDNGGQFVDRGTQYRTAIFYHNETQKKLAEKSRRELIDSGKFSELIVTPVIKLDTFYQAEDYHQDFYKSNPRHYKGYRVNSGRDQFIKKVWGDELKDLQSRQGVMDKNKVRYSKPDDAMLRKKLSDLQYKVTQQNGTEPPFENPYWDNKQKGIYVDIVSGEPLFSSKDKFKSGTGWPSFTKPLVPQNIVEVKDTSFFMVRVEVRSKHGDSHLGHVFPDGPEPTGLRYCINSASIKFIPEEKLDAEGYGAFMGK